MTSKKRGYREGAVDQRGPNTWRLRFRTAMGNGTPERFLAAARTLSAR